jgi:ABC-type uncharacterized transport system substrate-binding protein
MIEAVHHRPDGGGTRAARTALASMFRLSWALLFAVLLLAAAQFVEAAGTVGKPTEQRVRAALVFNFIKLTEWPAAAGQELLLCTSSADSNLNSAIAALAGRMVGDKQFLTASFSPQADCDVIYVDSRQRWNEIYEGRKLGHALTVGGYAGFIKDGGMIEITTEDGSPRFSINQVAAKRAGLGFQPQLLRLAKSAEAIVWIALSGDGSAYAEAAAAVEDEIGRAGPGRGEVIARPWRQFVDGTLSPPPRLVVAIGSEALRGIVEGNIGVPALAVLVPEAAYERLATRGSARDGTAYSAVLLEQPPARQLAVLRLALPQRHRIGMLFGPDSRRLAAAFQRAATASGMQLVIGQVDAPDRVGAVLQQTIEEVDLLLAVADPTVFNNASVQNILTTAYRRRLPVAGFSPAYVRAGALLAIYSTPEQLGRQAGQMARLFLSGQPLPPPQAPSEFTLGINGEVARSLGIPLRVEDGAALAAQLQESERKP